MRMRSLAVVAGVAVLGSVLVAEDVPAMFNLKLETAHGYVVGAMHRVTGRNVDAYDLSPIQKVKGEARVALIRTALKWAKEYTESEQFGTEYANERKRLEPRPPITRTPVDQVLARQKTDLDQRIAMEKKRLELPPPRMMTPEQVEATRKATETRLKDYETRRAAFDDPQSFAALRTKLDAPAAAERRDYESALAKWNEENPADYRTLIVKRLQEFLSQTADVDFGAKLVPCTTPRFAGLRCFANPAYENKSPEWKLYYRAGKPSLDAARAFATSWLAEIEKK